MTYVRLVLLTHLLCKIFRQKMRSLTNTSWLNPNPFAGRGHCHCINCIRTGHSGAGRFTAAGFVGLAEPLTSEEAESIASAIAAVFEFS
jgi:hypothetical protein